MYLGIISSCGPMVLGAKSYNAAVKHITLTNGCKGLSGPRTDLKHFGQFIDAYPYDEKQLKHQSKINYTIQEVKAIICEFFKQQQQTKYLYYSGHGAEGTGSWILETKGENYKMHPEELYQMWMKHSNKNEQLIVVSDSCFSGQWANEVIKQKYKKYNIVANCASFPKNPAYDLGVGYGGFFTYKLTQGIDAYDKQDDQVFKITYCGASKAKYIDTLFNNGMMGPMEMEGWDYCAGTNDEDYEDSHIISTSHYDK